MAKKKLIIICGPTGTGKTETAIKIAKEIDGCLVNCDSTQVYRDVDVGTNKGQIDYENSKEFSFYVNGSTKTIPIFKIENVDSYLFSFLLPDEQFNVFGWKKLAIFAIEEIYKNGKIPVLVGGTGLYIDSLLNNYQDTHEMVNYTRRDYLRSLSLEELTRIVSGINPQWEQDLNASDKVNPVRLIRYIERKENVTIADGNNNVPDDTSNRFDRLLLYPTFLSESMRSRLRDRAYQIVSDKFITEVEMLAANYDEDCPVFKIIGYKEVRSYLKGELSLEECREKVFLKHWQYFRRQKTWFEGKGRNYDLIKYKDADDALLIAKRFLSN